MVRPISPSGLATNIMHLSVRVPATIGMPNLISTSGEINTEVVYPYRIFHMVAVITSKQMVLNPTSHWIVNVNWMLTLFKPIFSMCNFTHGEFKRVTTKICTNDDNNIFM